MLKKLKNAEKVKRGPTNQPTDHIAGCRVAYHATKKTLVAITSMPLVGRTQLGKPCIQLCFFKSSPQLRKNESNDIEG